MDGEILGSSWSVTCRRVPAENKIGVKKPFFVSDFFKLSGSQGRAHARFHTITTGTRWRGPIDGEPRCLYEQVLAKVWASFPKIFKFGQNFVLASSWWIVRRTKIFRMPAVIWTTYWDKILKVFPNILPEFWKFHLLYSGGVVGREPGHRILVNTAATQPFIPSDA